MSTGIVMRLAHRLQNVWVRLRLFPENAATLQLDATRPVCYVLNENWLSDRLALEDAVAALGLPPAGTSFKLATRRLASAEFSLERGWRLFGKARERYAVPTKLARLIEAVLTDASVDVQLVPVTVLWGRAPKQQDGILRALLAESWQRRQPLGHWLAVFLHGRHTHVHFGQPLSLRELLNGLSDQALAGKKCARVLRTHFRRQREIAIGPDVSHRHTQVEALLESPDVRKAIEAEAARTQVSLEEAAARARRNALAIASDYSYAVVRAGEIFLTWLWTRLFDGVEVRNFEMLAQLAAENGIVYLPCHRSHLDYLLLSYVIFRGGLTPPHIAAGDNLDLPLLGLLLRRGGAFFLRRSFKGDPLYATIFVEYLQRMLARGFPVEYFIEGGRSRSGRLLPPKTGLLGMTVQGFVRHHERPLMLVPVYVGYEKLPEGASFVNELAGRPKQRESWWGLLSSVRLLRRHFGRVYVNFGAPLDLAAWLDGHHPDWRSTPLPESGDGGMLRVAVSGIADEVARRINAATLVNPVNLVALALLGTPKATADADALARQIEHLQALLPAAQADALAAPREGMACIAAALKLEAVHRIEHPLGELIGANASEAALLAYFRNNVIHLYALPALIACLIVQHGPMPEARLRELLEGMFPLMRTNLYLWHGEAGLPGMFAEVLGQFEARELIARFEGVIQMPAANSRAGAELEWLGEILRPQMERYFLVLTLLKQRGSGRLSRKELTEHCTLLAQRLILLHAGKTPEFADRTLFAAMIGFMLDNGILREDALQRLEFGELLERAAAQAESLLASDVRELLLRLV